MSHGVRRKRKPETTWEWLVYGHDYVVDMGFFLIIGVVLSLAWAHMDYESYHAIMEYELLHNHWIGHYHGHGEYVITPHWLINDFGMAFFFAIAMKEVFESFLPGGAMRSKTAVVPILATFGGVVGPIITYLTIVKIMGMSDELSGGWPIATATDIAFSIFTLNMVLGAKHPGGTFMKLLAILDDAVGMVIIAVKFPQAPFKPELLIGFFIVAIIIGLVMKKGMKLTNWRAYMLPGLIFWLGTAVSGLHPALGMMPVVLFMPHAKEDSGIFDWHELELDDTLNTFEHEMKRWVEYILGFFALANAGIVIQSWGAASTAVFGGLGIGKIFGVFILGSLAARFLGYPLGINKRILLVLGAAAGIGFTVALFMAPLALEAGPHLAFAKLGALASFGMIPLTMILGKLFRVRKINTDEELEQLKRGEIGLHIEAPAH